MECHYGGSTTCISLQNPTIQKRYIANSGDLLIPGADFQSIQRTNQGQLETTKRGRLTCNHPSNQCKYPDWAYSWCCTITIGLFFFIFYLVTQYENGNERIDGEDEDEDEEDEDEGDDCFDCEGDSIPYSKGIIGVICFLYLASSCCLCFGRVFQSINNTEFGGSGGAKTKEEVDASVQKVKQNPLKIYIAVVTYHEEGTSEDSKTVVTHREQVLVPYQTCLDLSKDKIDYGHYPCILIQQTLEVCCGEPENANMLESMRKAAFERCKNKDKHCTAEILYQVDGFPEFQSVVSPQWKFCINGCVICLSNIVLLSPLWYMWFYLCGSGSVQFQHKRVVFFNQSPTSVPQQGQVLPFAAPGAGVQMIPMAQPGMMPMAQQQQTAQYVPVQTDLGV